MNAAAVESVLNFEVYLLVTMKNGMLTKQNELVSKLAEHGFSLDGASRVHHRIDRLFEDESSQFDSLKRLGVAPSASDGLLTYSSVFWPEFDFSAVAGERGELVSAGYRRARGDVQSADSPLDQPTWTMGVEEFAQSFGPLVIDYKSPLFGNALPAHEWYKFEWEGRKYGAAFSWGLFLDASILWT